MIIFDIMSYFHYIDNGEGPTKLFIGGVHGDEGKDVLPLIKRLSNEDFSSGQIYIYNFDKTPYVSTIHREFYESEQGKKILDLIDYYKPDFYTELHSYNIKHFEKLTSLDRLDKDGIPPLIDCSQYVLCSSVSPLIRRKHMNIIIAGNGKVGATLLQQLSHMRCAPARRSGSLQVQSGS